jgi:carboxyl-terminal processing protease
MREDLDPHSTYVEPEEFSRMNERNTGEYEGIGISFEIREGWITVISAIEGGPSDHLGIRPGDRIVEIEGESTKDMANQDVVSRLKGAKGTKVSITVERPGLEKPLFFTIARDKIPIYSVPYSFLLDDGKTGYIRMTRFSATTSDELEKALTELESAGMQQLVLDLRNNSGGFLNQAIEVADKFIGGNEVVVYTKGRIEGSSQYYYSTESGTHPGYPLIVLVNHGSASASEIVSGAVQDHDRGLIAGVTTFGKGLVQRQYMLSDNSALLLTVARYYTPSGRLIQRSYEDRDEYLEHWRTDSELEAADSLAAAVPDTAGRPLFYTLNEKRPVFGGGGIAPDIRIADTFELNEVQSKLEQSRLFFEFANEFAARNLDKNQVSLDSFLDTYQMPASAIAEFRRRALATDVVKLTATEVDAEEDYIARALKREIAGNLWGSEARYRVILNEDPVLAQAVIHFPEAVAMAKVYQEAMENQR